MPKAWTILRRRGLPDSDQLTRVSWLANWGTFWGVVVSALVAALTLAGLAVAYFAGRDAQRMQIETLQRQAQSDSRAQYSRYLEMSIEHPDLASGAAFNSRNDRTRQSYEWFVAYLLFTCERVIDAHPQDYVWGGLCVDQVKLHADYLRSAEFEPHLREYGPDMQMLLIGVIDEDQQ